MQVEVTTRHYAMLGALVIIAIACTYFLWTNFQRIGAIIGADKGAPSQAGGHPINQKHGTVKAWLSASCPWCKKQVAVFEKHGIAYEEQTGSPPGGDGVPQTQSAKTGNICQGFKEVDDLAKCLDG